MPDKAGEGSSKAEPNRKLNYLTLLLGVVVSVTALLTFGDQVLTRLTHLYDPPGTFGKCGLKLQLPANVKRINGYIEEGQQFAANHSFDLAARRFQQVIDIDPNYLGAHQDLGVVQLALGEYDKAQVSFEAEIDRIDCLRSVGPSNLHFFAYALDKEKLGKELSGALYLDRLNAAEDTAHYNLACTFAHRHEPTAAVNELRKAAEHHSIQRNTVSEDTDLSAVRKEAGYQSVLALF